MKPPEITQKGDRVVLCQSTRNGRRQTIELEPDQIDDVMEELRKARGSMGGSVSTEPIDAEEERQDSFGRL